MKKFLLNFLVFVFFANAIGWSFFFHAKSLNEAELARGEQTMGPGWTMFTGLVLAPIGGFIAVLVMVTGRRLISGSRKGV